MLFYKHCSRRPCTHTHVSFVILSVYVAVYRLFYAKVVHELGCRILATPCESSYARSTFVINTVCYSPVVKPCVFVCCISFFMDGVGV